MRFYTIFAWFLGVFIVNVDVRRSGISKTMVSKGLLAELNRLPPVKRRRTFLKIGQKLKTSTERRLKNGRKLRLSDVSNFSSDNLKKLGSEIMKNGANRASRNRIQKLLNSYSLPPSATRKRKQRNHISKLPPKSKASKSKNLLGILGNGGLGGFSSLINGFGLGGIGSIFSALGGGSNLLKDTTGTKNTNSLSSFLKLFNVANSLGLANLGKDEKSEVDTGADDLNDDWGEDNLGDDWGDDLGDDLGDDFGDDLGDDWGDEFGDDEFA